MVDRRAGGVQIAQRDAPVAADDRVAVQSAGRRIGAGVAAGKGDDVLAHCLCREVHRLARDHRAGAGEGTGVVGRAVGIGDDDVDVAGLHAHDGGRDLLVRRDDAVAHLGRTAGQMIGAVGQQLHLRAGAMLGRRSAFEHRHGHARALGPLVAGKAGDAVAPGQLALDDVEALGDAVAAEARIAGLAPYRFDVVARPHDVPAAHLDRIDREDARHLVDRALDGEGRLRGAIAAEAAARHHVGVDRVTRALLVVAAVGGKGAAHGGRQRLAAVIAIGAGVGHDAHVHRGQGAVLARADPDMGGHLMPGRGADELVLARPFPLHGTTDLHRGEQDEVFRDHLLLAAEAAADALGEDVEVAGPEAHQVAELLLGRERSLGAGADVPAPVLALPGDRTVRLEMDVLHARRRIGHLVDGVGFLEALGDVADLAMQVAVDIAAVGDDVLVVQKRGTGFHCKDRIEDGREEFILDPERETSGFRRAFALRNHRGDALSGEAHDIVEHVGVVGIDEMILVQCGAVEPPRHVLPVIDRDDAGHRQCRRLVDPRDARMSMRRAQHLEVQHARHRDVHRIARPAGQDRVGEGIGQAGAARLAGRVRLDVALPVQRVGYRAITGAAAEIALQRMRQVCFLLLAHAGRGHDHAGGAEAALEGLCVVEGLLDGMHPALGCKTLDGGDLAALGTEGRDQAGMERLSVDPDGAGAAIAGIAALLHAEHFEVAQEGAQTLSGAGIDRVESAVDFVPAHASSARICSAK